MDAKGRNDAAWDRAIAEPEAVADAAERSATLAEILEARWREVHDRYGCPRTDLTSDQAEWYGPLISVVVHSETLLRDAFPIGDDEDPVGGGSEAWTDDEEEWPELLCHEWPDSLCDEGPGRALADAVELCIGLAGIPAGNDLAALTLVVEEMPADVTPDHRQDKRILPRIVEGAHHPDRERGMLFGGLHEGRRIEAPELPLFPDFAPAKRVPMLDLVDAAGLPVMARGRGAPLPLRLFVRTLASVRPTDRKLASVRLALTLRELRDGLFPNGWRSGQHWPELRHALMHARDYAIHDGRGRWFPVALRYLPDTPDLDDLVVLDVAYPPGSHSGPAVNLPDMDRLSVTSAPRWRAYIAAHSLAWQPGTTRVPAPRAGGHYLWTRDRSAYPVLTVQDRRRLAFGAGDRKHRTRTEIDAAFRDLPGLVVVSEQAANTRTGEVGWLVIPEEAARALTDPEDDTK